MNLNAQRFIAGILVISLVATFAYAVNTLWVVYTVDSYEACADAYGSKIMFTDPPQCSTIFNQTFVGDVAVAEGDTTVETTTYTADGIVTSSCSNSALDVTIQNLSGWNCTYSTSNATVGGSLELSTRTVRATLTNLPRKPVCEVQNLTCEQRVVVVVNDRSLTEYSYDGTVVEIVGTVKDSPQGLVLLNIETDSGRSLTETEIADVTRLMKAVE